MSMFNKLDSVVERFETLTEKLADPSIYDRQAEFKKISSERSNLEERTKMDLTLHWTYVTTGSKNLAVVSTQNIENLEVVKMPEVLLEKTKAKDQTIKAEYSTSARSRKQPNG